MRLVDANVLLYAVNEDAREHAKARVWLEASLNGRETVGFAWLALLAFVRLSTRPGIFPQPLDPCAACGFVDEWLARPVSVVLSPTSRHPSILRGLLEEAGTAGNLTSDAHLAALAIEHGAGVWSFDRDFNRFAGLTAHVPT